MKYESMKLKFPSIFFSNMSKENSATKSTCLFYSSVHAVVHPQQKTRAKFCIISATKSRPPFSGRRLEGGLTEAVGGVTLAFRDW